MAMNEAWNTGLMAHLGIRIVQIDPDRVVGELEVRDELKTVGPSVHGGTLMAFADTVGAVGTAALGFKTATLESKTNFFAAATAGKLRAEATALHKGKRSHVWQTRVTDEAGRLLSLTIQTQMIL
jgi:1,4-dihydroxy-2-naphthoyl-CoA hydrolase